MILGMAYPRWSYYPRNARPPAWVAEFVAVVADHEHVISTVERKTELGSDAVLAALADGLSGLGYQVERSKAANDRIKRPVLFGENGVPEVSYEIDAFHDQLGIAVEIEAGRGARGNANYRDIVRTSLILDASYMVLGLPCAYRHMSSSREITVRAYEDTRHQLDAIYASQRIRLPFEGVLLVGY